MSLSNSNANGAEGEREGLNAQDSAALYNALETQVPRPQDAFANQSRFDGWKVKRVNELEFLMTEFERKIDQQWQKYDLYRHEATAYGLQIKEECLNEIKVLKKRLRRWEGEWVKLSKNI